MCGITLLLHGILNYDNINSQLSLFQHYTTNHSYITSFSIEDNNDSSSEFSYLPMHFYSDLLDRGPDSLNHISDCDFNNDIKMDFIGSLLQLRGKDLMKIPLQDQYGNILLFNGEIYAGLDNMSSSIDNDAYKLFLKLNEIGDLIYNFGVIEILTQLQGPWSLIYYQKKNKTIYFGRDPIGRRSLLLHKPVHEKDKLIISSVRPYIENNILESGIYNNKWMEIEPGIYSIKIESNTIDIKNYKYDTLWQNILRNEEMTSVSDRTTIKEISQELLLKLNNAIKIRCNTMHYIEILNEKSVLVLFSGGVDSMLISIILHLNLDKDYIIDLCNVSFDKQNSPDRINTIKGYCELREWAPERLWRLIEVDAELEDIDKIKCKLINLMNPSNSVMDLNIGAALYLAAKAEGKINSYLEYLDVNSPLKDKYNEINDKKYKSKSRIVFTGHGADEIAAGYGRHKTKYKEGGWNKLINELNMDIKRIWLRNLGRDERLCASHGREIRYPFLDEELLIYFSKINIKFIFNPDLPKGEGDKMILREILRSNFGFKDASRREKRAIQFGSSLGKKMNCRNFGSNRSANKVGAGYVNLETAFNFQKNKDSKLN